MDVVEILTALMTREARVDPYPIYAEAHKLGAAAPSGAAEWPVVLVPGYEAANRVLRDPAFVVVDDELRKLWDPSYGEHSSVTSVGSSILSSNPPNHGRVRSLISSVFTPRRVAALQPAVVASLDRLLDAMAADAAAGRPVDFMEQLASPLPVTVICELLGVPEADRHLFRPLAHDLTVSLELITDPAVLIPADAAADELDAYFTALAAERRANPQDDLVSALVQARDAEDGRLSDTELLANLTLLLVAGFETTTNLLGNGLALLFQHPEVTAGLRAGEIPAASFVEEVLRFDSPVQLTSRFAFNEGMTAGGVPVPVNNQALMLIGAANRDPNRYEDPDRFDPLRKDISPLSFGAGAHYCLGQALARMEAVTAFPRLLERFPAIAPAPDAAPTRRDRLVLRGYETLPVSLGS